MARPEFKSLVEKEDLVLIPTHILTKDKKWESINISRHNWANDAWIEDFSHIVQIADNIILAYWITNLDIEKYGEFSIYKCEKIEL